MNEFFEVISRLAGVVTPHLPLWAGVFARISAIAFLAPALGEIAVPARIRLAATVAFTLIIAPAVSDQAAAREGAAALLSLIIAEIAAGLLIGFALRLSIFSLQVLGAVAAQAMSLSQLFGPGIGHDQESPISTILIAAGLALACAAGFHLKLAGAIVDTYSVLPFGDTAFLSEAGEFIAAESAKVLAIAFGMAAPFVILGIAYSVALAAANRAMPQMAVIFVGAPAIAFGGLALLAGAASVILSRWSESSVALFQAPLGGLP